MERKISKTILVLMTIVLLFVLAACKTNKPINNLSGDFGFTVEGEFEEGSILVVQPLRAATNQQKKMIIEKNICVDYNMKVYDISIEKDNIKVQPNKIVKVTLLFDGDSPNGYTVFHFKSDSEMEVLKPTINDNKLSFETTSFSVFIIGENKPEEYSYNITYNLDGGEFQDGAILHNKYDSNSEFPLALPNPKKSGYAFKGWKNAYGVEIIEITSDIRGDITLTAQWEKAAEPAYIMSEDGKTVTFGSYPQTLVKDEDLSAKLTKKVDLFPALNDGRGWTSFDFYSEGKVRNYAWYKDIEHEGVQYRGIYFNEYRMYEIRIKSSALIGPASTSSMMYRSGVRIETVYWFKFEPIKWRVLTKTDGRAFLMCDNAIFAMHFQHAESGIPCDYAKSDIRQWLNESFYNLAFGSAQKSIIRDTIVDNSEESAKPKDKEYADLNTGNYGTPSENTIDKVFLLSVNDVTNPEYGFAADPWKYASTFNSTGRSVDWTEYGIYVGGTNHGYYHPNANCEWVLRSPMYIKRSSTLEKNLSLVLCNTDGTTCTTLMPVYFNEFGIVPAIWINL